MAENPDLVKFREKMGSEYAEELTDSDIRRFLRARSNNMEKAVSMAAADVKWRNTEIDGDAPLTPKTIINNGDPHEHLYQQHCPHSNLGYDRMGCPIYWEKTGLISKNFPAVKACLKFDDLVSRHIRQQEYVFQSRLKLCNEVFGEAVRDANHAADKNGEKKKVAAPPVIEKQTIVMDLKDLSFALDSTALSVFRKTLAIDEAHYPERLQHMFMINAPWFFCTVWSMVKPWVDPITANKITILGSDYYSTLKKFIDPSQIPTELGGERAVFAWTFPESRTLDTKAVMLSAIGITASTDDKEPVTATADKNVAKEAVGTNSIPSPEEVEEANSALADSLSALSTSENSNTDCVPDNITGDVDAKSSADVV